VRSNCILEDRAAADTWEPDYDRCRAGAGPHGLVGRRREAVAGERTQQPCCVARDYNSIHQSRPVAKAGLHELNMHSTLCVQVA
jgi:hypothetical protein